MTHRETPWINLDAVRKTGVENPEIPHDQMEHFFSDKLDIREYFRGFQEDALALMEDDQVSVPKGISSGEEFADWVYSLSSNN